MLKNAVADGAMWDNAVRDIDSEQHAQVVAKATVALSGTWPFLAAAQSNEEFNHRLALMQEQIEQITPGNVLNEVVAGLRSKFEAVLADRLADTTQRRTAARTIALAEGQVSLPDAYVHVHKHAADGEEMWQVDHVAGPSFINTVAHAEDHDEAMGIARQFNASAQLPLYENGKHVEGVKNPEPEPEFIFHAGLRRWVPLYAVASVPGDEGMSHEALVQDEYNRFNRSPDWELSNIHKALNYFPMLNGPRELARLDAVKKIKAERRGRKSSHTAAQVFRPGGGQAVGLSAQAHERLRGNWGDALDPVQAGSLKDMTFHESYGPVSREQLRAYKKYNVSQSDHDDMVDHFGEDANEAITKHVIQHSSSGMYNPGWRWQHEGAYQPDPDAGWRYHYPPHYPVPGQGGAPTATGQGGIAAPFENSSIGPDEFPIDVAQGENRSEEAYARQLTPGTWTVTPGTEWPSESKPNAATGLAQGEFPHAGSKGGNSGSIYCTQCGGQGMRNMGGVVRNCTACKGTGIKRGPRRQIDKDLGPDFLGDHEASRRVTADGGVQYVKGRELQPGHQVFVPHFMGKDRLEGHPINEQGYWDEIDKLPGQHEHRHNSEEFLMKGVNGNTPHLHYFDRSEPVAVRNNPDSDFMKDHFKIIPVGARHQAEFVDPPYRYVNVDGSGNPQGIAVRVENGSWRLAGEGIVPTPGPNPNYFSQGTQGVQGPPEFPEDPSSAIEPKTDNHMDDIYGAVPPQVSSGSEQNYQVGTGYSNTASRGRLGFSRTADEDGNKSTDDFYNYGDRGGSRIEKRPVKNWTPCDAGPGDHKADYALYRVNPVFGDDQHLGNVCKRHDDHDNPALDDYHASRRQKEGAARKTRFQPGYPHMTIHPAQSYRGDGDSSFDLHPVKMHEGPGESFSVGDWPAESVEQNAATYGRAFMRGHGHHVDVPVHRVTASRLGFSRAAEYHYIRERDGKFEVWQKGTGKTLSTHDSREDAEASFRAMMQSKHGTVASYYDRMKPQHYHHADGPEMYDKGYQHGHQGRKPVYTGHEDYLIGHRNGQSDRQVEDAYGYPTSQQMASRQHLATGNYDRDFEEGEEHGLAGHDLTHAYWQPTRGYIDGHAQGANKREELPPEEQEYFARRGSMVDVHYQDGFTGTFTVSLDGRTAASDVPDAPRGNEAPYFKPGDHVEDFRGDTARVHQVIPSTHPGKSHRVQVTWDDPEKNSGEWEWAPGGGGFSEHDPASGRSGDSTAYYQHVFRHHIPEIGSMVDDAVSNEHDIGRAYASVSHPIRTRDEHGNMIHSRAKFAGFWDQSKSAATDGKIVGMCDHCQQPVRYHSEGGGHLRHLHNGSPKCKDGKISTAMIIDAGGGYEARFKLPQFIAAGDFFRAVPGASGECEMCGRDATHTLHHSDGHSMTPVAEVCTQHAGEYDEKRVAKRRLIFGDSVTAGAVSHDRLTQWGRSNREAAVLENPSQDNPTGKGEDPYRSKTTWEGYEHQRPRQNIEGEGGMNANTPTMPQDPIRTGPSMNTPNQGSPLDKDGPRERADQNEQDEDDDGDD